ncbi:hypothetical protein HRbin36_02358 [bacterium HR36]|nr:hypothetical protein HRbin36_02358 [bacterium HR36]
MLLPLGLLAAEPGPARQLLWLWLALGGAVLVFAVILAIARSLYLRIQQQKEVERELLAEFQEAVERGEMSPEEFARVRRLLIGRMTGESAPLPPPPAKAADVREEDLPILEQESYTSPAAENADQPQQTERKTDSDSASPESSSAG